MQAWMQNGRPVRNGNQGALCNNCACGPCPSFTGRPVIYVDKYASGTGDGSSWENAYTSIQDALFAHPKKEVRVKGYGESDCYFYNNRLWLPQCSYLKGVGDVWLDGNNYTVLGIYGYDFTKIENINIKRTRNAAIAYVSKVVNCTVKDIRPGRDAYNYHFFSCGSVESCRAYNPADRCIGFYCCTNVNDCIAEDLSIGHISNTEDSVITNSMATNCYYGFRMDRGNLINCEANNCKEGMYVNFGANAIDCVSSHNQTLGFYGYYGNFLNCTAYSNNHCGFTGQYCTFAGCNEYNNCLEWEGDCTGHSCNEV